MEKMMKCEHDFEKDCEFKTICLTLLVMYKCKKCGWYKYKHEEIVEDDKEI